VKFALITAKDIGYRERNFMEPQENQEIAMKKKTIGDISRLAIWIMLLMISVASTASGQYELSWSTIDGGGGTSSGGTYTLTGTIGQPEAGAMSGGPYELLGGFWPGGPLCFVDFYSFARFAEQWLYRGVGLEADLSGDDKVNFADLKLFVAEWLYSCPPDWQLK